MIRSLLLGIVAAGCLSGCAFDEELFSSESGPEPAVVYVHQTSHPAAFDPYYDQPKVYYASRPQYYYEDKSKKTKGNKVYKTTTIRNEYGQTVYKETTSHKKKKK